MPHQRTGDGLKRLGCLVSVFLPYEMASCLLAQWSGIKVSDSSLWNWVQEVGARAVVQLEASVNAYTETGEVMPEALAETVAQMRLVIGADGVMVPFRPTPGTPKGKTQWKEVKIGVFARLGERLTHSGQS
ncbi:MAG: ISKra4 family transposase, partial [Symploca sp. SIO1B1]|nr:ISKra4 family transposase [Symploca sp. SIO1B1]